MKMMMEHLWNNTVRENRSIGGKISPSGTLSTVDRPGCPRWL